MQWAHRSELQSAYRSARPLVPQSARQSAMLMVHWSVLLSVLMRVPGSAYQSALKSALTSVMLLVQT